MSPQRPRRNRSERATLPAGWRRWRAPAALVAAVALGAWLQLTHRQSRSFESSAAVGRRFLRDRTALPVSDTAASSTARSGAHEAIARAPDARAAGLVEPGAEPSPAEPVHPHPITPEHRRIFEENNRVGALNGAMDRGDFVALRRLNAAYGRDYPEDAHALQRAYDLIADCLEQRTPRAVDAARRFWQTHRASTLRRHVRRICLDEPKAP